MSNNKIEFDGIGTHWWINIYDDLNFDISSELISIVKEFESNYSRFKDTSLVSKLNNNKVIKNFPEELFNMFEYAEKLKILSDGYFNIFVGKTLENFGYDKDYSFKAKAIQSISNDCFELLTKKEIRINEEARIDLGGLGKGWLVDKVAEYLKSKGIKYFYVNAGGDIYATSNFNKAINFILENPLDPSEMIGSIDVFNQSIASSSTNRRRWRDQNKEYHHLINPRNNESVNNKVAGVFTLGNNCLKADVASTVIFVSPKDLRDKIKDKLGVEYLVIFEDGSYFRSGGYTAILNN